MKILLWPDGFWINAEDYNSDIAEHQGASDDYRELIVPDAEVGDGDADIEAWIERNT